MSKKDFTIHNPKDLLKTISDLMDKKETNISDLSRKMNANRQTIYNKLYGTPIQKQLEFLYNLFKYLEVDFTINLALK